MARSLVKSPSEMKMRFRKKLIIANDRKETVGRMVLYEKLKDFLIQFGLKDLIELPSIEDFEDIVQ
ncbi:MAG TPA: hypothetical protein PKE69_02905 [Pyrinomonadaceae bacterium]|nr:hypothetical protein [Pyrinomonadaceae bacterium]